MIRTIKIALYVFFLAVSVPAILVLFLASLFLGASLFIVFGPIACLLFAIYLGHYATYFSRRVVVRLSASSAIDDARPPILLLRSFASDSAFEYELLGRKESEEEALAFNLKQVGPVVAVAKPNELLPTLGAAKIYLSDADWPTHITSLMARSPLVILRVGFTEGLLWEISASARMVDARKLVIWHPGLRWASPETWWRWTKAYKRFRMLTKESFGASLPKSFSWRAEFMYFDHANRPRFSMGFAGIGGMWRNYLSLSRVSAIQPQLVSVLRNAGLPATRVKLRPIEMVNYIILAIFLASFAYTAWTLSNWITVPHILENDLARRKYSSDVPPNGWARIFEQNGAIQTMREAILSNGNRAQMFAWCAPRNHELFVFVAFFDRNLGPIKLERGRLGRTIISLNEKSENSSLLDSFDPADVQYAQLLRYSNSAFFRLELAKPSAKVFQNYGVVSGWWFLKRLETNSYVHSEAAILEVRGEMNETYSVDLAPQEANFQALVRLCHEPWFTW